MKAAVQTGTGDVERIQIQDVPEPKPGPGEVKIKVAAVSINPIDWKLLHGAYPLPAQWVMGFDVAGEVVDIGPGVEDFQQGDRVLGNVRHSFAEYAVAPASDLAHIPAKLSIEEAAALPLATLTGAQLIEEHTKPESGQTVLITGAMGSVGRTAVYAAKLLGARVLAGVRKQQKEEAAELGADGVYAIDDPAEAEKVPEVDAIADTVGGDTINSLLPHLRNGGRLGSVVGEPGGARDRGILVDAFQEHPDGHRLQELADSVARGDIRIPIGRTFTFSQVRDAVRYAQEGHGGKVLLTM
jgi:NADPH:quinone reductase-like Zn-dependent oxidoreductase